MQGPPFCYELYTGHRGQIEIWTGLQTFECREECKVFNFGINFEFISIAAAMCITWTMKKKYIKRLKQIKNVKLSPTARQWQYVNNFYTDNSLGLDVGNNQPM